MASPGTPAGRHVLHREGASRQHLQQSLKPAHHSHLPQPPFVALRPFPWGQRGKPSELGVVFRSGHLSKCVIPGFSLLGYLDV